MTDKYCHYCGQRISEDSTFCPKCGKNVLRRKGNVKKKDRSILKIAVAFLGIFALSAGIVFYLMTRDTGINFDAVKETSQQDAVVSPVISDPPATPVPTPAITETPTPTQALPSKSPSPSPKAVKNGLYKNNRYGFSIEYTADLFNSSGSSSNGDGIALYGDDITVSVYGSNNVFHKTLEQEYAEAVSSTNGVSYDVLKSNFYVISGTYGDTIYYHKEYVGEGSINTLLIEYPKSMKNRYDAEVTKLSKSFKNGNLSGTY